MFYMASKLPVAVVRANLLLVLIVTDAALLVAYFVNDRLMLSGVVLGAVVAVPYLLANIVGARLFDPAREGLYRGAAYVIIAASAILGLPLFS